jgi:16S rRNA (adenine1518-N6/adenine1519-N6)-dimethyltransferase
MPLTPTQTRERLAALNLRPSRALGQNFLVDGNIVRKSLQLAALQPGDAAVEVGPGLGTLTEALLAAGAEVWAVEKDRVLVAELERTLVPAAEGRLHLLAGDAVESPLAGLPPGRAARGFSIVANLPYAISTPWMDAVLGGPLPQRMVLMLQREAAARYTAAVGSKSFGAISIFLQSAFTATASHPVSAACFHPRPEIDSCLQVFERRPEPFVFSADRKALIRRLFQRRRKQITALVRDEPPDSGAAAWLEAIVREGMDPRARPEDIPVALWARIGVTSPMRMS